MNLDNREFALLIWLTLFFVALHWKTQSRAALYGILHALTQRQILYVLGFLACYVTACIWLLSSVGWWQISNLKTTLLWTTTFIFISIFHFNKIESDKSYFRRTLMEAVSIGAFLSFVSSSHTFSLPLELAITFSLLMLSVTIALSMSDTKLQSIQNLATILLAILSFPILSNSVYHIITEFNEFATSNTAREFMLPILLTAMSLPLLYGLCIYSTYERVFVSLNITIKDPILRRKARRCLITKFRCDVVALEKWRRHSAIFEQSTMNDIDSSIREIKKARAREKNPSLARPKIGWAPHEAINFLSAVNLPTDDYHRSYTGWRASSSYLDVDKELIPNNIAYYIEGEEFATLKLKLVLNINSPQGASGAQEIFFQFIGMLVLAAIPDKLQPDIESSLNVDAFPLHIGNYALTLERENWPNGINGGYELRFAMTTDSLKRESATQSDHNMSQDHICHHNEGSNHESRWR